MPGMRHITIAAVLCGLTSCSKPDAAPAPPADSTPARAAAPTAPPPIASAEPQAVRTQGVELATLLSEYKDNEVRADSRFKEKRIQTHGIVREVKKDIAGKIYVTIGRGEALEIPALQCYVGSAFGQEQAAASLSSGKPVTVRGTVDGLMMNVLVRDCFINPVMQLCERLKVALNGEKCRTDDSTGDANGLIIRADETAQNMMFAALVCELSTGDKSADEVYSAKIQGLRAEKGAAIIGSQRAACFGLFVSKVDGKDAPLPDDVKQKAQAVFDGI
jgi:hypothetical protein